MRVVIMSLWLLSALAGQTRAEATAVCVLVVNAATQRAVVEQGDCDLRATPASTFKIALAVMGYDSGFLVDAETPRLAPRAGDPDWGGPAWTRATTPAAWMRHSVVWYSRRITHALGAPSLTRYAMALRYGNADFTGDPGRDNGLDRAWIASSLRISPREQVAFLGALATDALPVATEAMARTRRIVQRDDRAGWRIWGKTGSAWPRFPDGRFDRSSGWGWFVGWAERDGQTLIFARLAQDVARAEESPGARARAAFLDAWPMMAARSAGR